MTDIFLCRPCLSLISSIVLSYTSLNEQAVIKREVVIDPVS